MAASKTSKNQRTAHHAKRSSTRAASPSLAEDPELSPAQVRELERRIEDLNCRTRYMIVSMLDSNFVLYYNISEDTYGWNDPSHATLFKRLKAAQTVLKLVGDKDTLVECEVNKRGQLIKKSVKLPQDPPRAKASSQAKRQNSVQRKSTRASTRKSKRKSEKRSSTPRG